MNLARPSNEGLFRGIAIALMLLFPVVYFASALFGATPSPIQPKPRWTQLFVLTVSEWPAVSFSEPSGLSRFAGQSGSIDQLYAPSLNPVSSAASLWTGRFQSRFQSGQSDRAAFKGLPPNSWTLVESLRASGARTAAFLQEPLISQSGIEGFESVTEAPTLDLEAMTTLVVERLKETSNKRNCIWLHVTQPTIVQLSTLATNLRAVAHNAGIGHESLIVITGFGTPKSLTLDGQSRAPLHMIIPGGTAAGLKGSGAASVVDLAGTLQSLLKLPPPIAPQKPLHSRGEHLWRLLNGGSGYQWLFIGGEYGDVLRFGRTRVAPNAIGQLVAEQTDDPRSDAGFHPAPKPLQAEMIGQYRQLVQLLAD
ncbi:MAG: hypothetical protein ACI8TQ_001707 [Planctomycetota bacterium]|jgi:hypothetical protein